MSRYRADKKSIENWKVGDQVIWGGKIWVVRSVTREKMILESMAGTATVEVTFE